jgi:cellulose synthase/poly-beta-1,6-N-acetylglucosamine synthase-like glycosyltransferase
MGLAARHMIKDLVYGALVVFSILVTIQSAHTLYLTLYIWAKPPSEALAPEQFRKPRVSFTVMLPARHEEAVIQATIGRVCGANYPQELIQVLVVCSADDKGTIAKVKEKISALRKTGLDNVSLVTFADGPVNKPHGLNVGLTQAVNDVVTIFDAEDDVHRDIFNVVNTIMQNERVRVVQAGVQLMNFDSSWYSALNVLEYFFWFKSRLHYHARTGAIPLGGNTVFFDRDLITRMGGWDEHNLTEDADIGLRLSAAGERIRVVYDDRYVTKEETPPTVSAFIRQRTRWSQGFMQTLKKGTWKDLPTRKQRLLAFYTLAFPRGQALLGIYVIISLLTMFSLKTPEQVALITFLPVLMILAFFLIYIIGLLEFTRAHGLQATPRSVLRMAVGWLPYQLMLSYAALRAVAREGRGATDWEKTQHVGAHREHDPDTILEASDETAA